jgi:hypothetical protein
VALLVAQGSRQQLPLPDVPQISELQSSFSVQVPLVIGSTQRPALQTKPLAQ